MPFSTTHRIRYSAVSAQYWSLWDTRGNFYSLFRRCWGDNVWYFHFSNLSIILSQFFISIATTTAYFLLKRFTIFGIRSIVWMVDLTFRELYCLSDSSSSLCMSCTNLVLIVFSGSFANCPQYAYCSIRRCCLGFAFHSRSAPRRLLSSFWGNFGLAEVY